MSERFHGVVCRAPAQREKATPVSCICCPLVVDVRSLLVNVSMYLSPVILIRIRILLYMPSASASIRG